MKIAEADYPRMAMFLEVMTDEMYGDKFASGAMPPDIHPSRVLETMRATSPAKARAGLGMAINDIVEDTLHWRPQQVADLNDKLKARGAATLVEVRAKHGKALARLLKRGRARNEDDVYLAKGMLDGPADLLDAQTVAALQSILSEFESRAVRD